MKIPGFHIVVMIKSTLFVDMILRQVLFDVRAGNSDLAKSLNEKSNHTIYQD